MSGLRRIDHAEARDRAAFFVLGALDARSAAEVREHLATCVEDHPEFAELGGVVPYLAESVEPVDGGPELRRRVMAIIAADARAEVRDDVAAERLIASFGNERRPAAATPDAAPAADEVTSPAAAQTDSAVSGEPARPAGQVPAAAGDTSAADAAAPLAPTAPETGLDGSRGDRPSTLWVDQPGGRPDALLPASLADRSPTRSWASRWAVPIVAAFLIAVLGAWNISLQQQASDVSRRAAELRTAIAASADPSARVARLAGAGTAATAKGFAAFSADGSGVLVIEGLAPAPAGRTYQAWYLDGSQARSAGLLRVESDGLAIATGLRPGGAFDTVALTLEPAGGVDQPTGLPPLVVGKVGA